MKSLEPAVRHSRRLAGSVDVGAARAEWAWALALYLILAVLTTLPGLGSANLIKMEGMVANMAEAMLDTGNYFVPTLYGEIYTYKPPLVYWLTAASMRAGGHVEWALRLPSALAPIVMGLVALLLVGRLTRPRAGLLVGVAAITNMMFFSKTKLAEFDSMLACGVGVAVVAACYNLVRGRRPGALSVWLLCYLALAAGVLTKGPPALMAFGPGLLAAALVTGRLHELLSWRHLAGAAIFTLLVGGYLWLLWDAAGAIAFEQPLAEARQRGFDWTLASFARTLAKPLIIMVGFLPWSLAWPWSLVTENRRDGEAESATHDNLNRASLAFLAAGMLVFMAVPTYEPRYFLPLSVPSAIVAVLALERAAGASRLARRLASALATLCAITLAAAGFAFRLPTPTRISIAAIGVAALLATWALVPRSPRQRVVRALLATALCGWAAETWVLRPERARVRDLRPLAAELGRLLPEGETIWVYGTPGEVGKHGALYFYLDRPVRAFLDVDHGPASGSHLILPAAASQELARRAPEFVARLEWIHTGSTREGAFLLYRLGPAKRSPQRVGAQAGPVVRRYNSARHIRFA